VKYFTRIAQCPICQSSDIEEFLELPYKGGVIERYIDNHYNLNRRGLIREYEHYTGGAVYVLASCHTCHCAFQVNRPNEELLGVVYESWIGEQSSAERAWEKLNLADSQHHFSEALKLVSLVLRLNSHLRPAHLNALDYGLGNGVFALALKACLVNAHGFEFSDIRLKFAERNGIEMIQRGDQLPSSHFHLINTEQVMEHVSDPHALITTLVDALAPGGILKVSVPLSRSLEKGDKSIVWSAERYAYGSPMPLFPLEHLQYFSRRTHVDISKRCNLRRIHIPKTFHLRYGLNWTISGAGKNIGRALFQERFRNYALFQKI
jgi:SAM-dependent methyltransferase